MPFVRSSYIEEPPLDWLRKAATGRLEMNAMNVWKALRHGAHVRIIGTNGDVLTEVSRLDQCASFRLTQRGRELAESGEKADLPFNKADPPLSIRLWVSAFRRWTRNCPKELCLAEQDGQLFVLAYDRDGKVKNDPAHRLASMKVPWHDS